MGQKKKKSWDMLPNSPLSDQHAGDMVAEVTIPSHLQNADASGCKSIGDTYRQPPMVIYSTYPSKSAQQTASLVRGQGQREL
jgi:hypothetical protein